VILAGASCGGAEDDSCSSVDRRFTESRPTRAKDTMSPKPSATEDRVESAEIAAT
jgi:hypothetical protein